MDLRHLTEQLGSQAHRGHFGANTAAAAAEYAALPTDFLRVVKYLADFCEDQLDDVREYDPALADLVLQTRKLFVQLMLLVYRDAKRADPVVAESFVTVFCEDFPDAVGSALLPKWQSLAAACHAFKEVAKLNSSNLVWTQSKALVQYWNEFLDGLLAPLSYAWRTAVGRKASSAVFGQAYGAKLNEFAQLTGGDDGIFYLFFRVGNPQLRNGLAHGSAWFDEETNIIRYTNGKKDKTEHTISLMEFMALCFQASYFCGAYLAALAVVVIEESGNPAAREALPGQFRKLLDHVPPTA